MDRDAVLLLGVEPNLRWRTFSSLIVDFAKELEVELVVTLGALLADVPHTRAAPVTGSATDPELVEQLGLQASRYEGPTGIVGVVHDACKRANIPSASLWAAVPHYVSLAPSPKAAAALCERLADLLGAEIDTAELDEAADAYVRRSARRSPPTRRPRRTSRSSNAASTRSTSRTSRRASRSPRSSRATSGSATKRTARPGGA